MARVSAILQGVNDRDFHSTRLREVLSLEAITDFLISVAFCRSEGVAEIADNLESIAAEPHIFLGIRNETTSAQGILSLLSTGLTPMVVDTATPEVLFHPKIYASWSDAAAKVMIGSANLTGAGLTRNIEASYMIDIDRSSREDEALFQELIKGPLGLPTTFPDHVFPIESAREVVQLLRQGRLVDERRSGNERSKRTPGEKGETALPPIPSFRKKPRARKKSQVTRQIRKSNRSSSRAGYVLVWESGPLTRRSLNVPDEDGTNITGDINLGAGNMEGLDFRHFFRDIAFEMLDWKADADPKTPHERAPLKFELIVKGISEGFFESEITHDPRTDTRSYEQRNVMTKLKWGSARPYIAREDLLGRTLSIYKNDRDEFVIAIP